MFIRDSNKLKHLVFSTGMVFGLYLGVHVVLSMLAGQGERQRAVYPWRDEDVLRYLLPSMFDSHEHERLWLVGPSEAREDLLAENFDAHFPNFESFQGALSLGTMDDFLLTLEYVERSYGKSAMPKVMVLGLTPRFVANIPRSGSPLVAAINKYSPGYKVLDGDDGPTLVEKSLTEGLASRSRFLMKQQKRYKAGIFGQALRYSPVIREKDSQVQAGEHASTSWMSYTYKPRGFSDRIDRKLRIYVMPYKYHNLKPMRTEGMAQWMNAKSSFWYAVHQWQPEAYVDMIRSRFARLLAIVDRLGIDLYVINLPEHPMNRAGYMPGRYESYQAMVSESLGDKPFLDLREMLDASEFYDVGHATFAGAQRVTAEVIAFLDSLVVSSSP